MNALWLNYFRARRYARHPQVTSFDNTLFPVEESQGVQVLNDVGAFIWNQLDVPRTLKELVSAVRSKYSVDVRTATADTRAFLAELSEKGLVVVFRGSRPPVAATAEPIQPMPLLSAAYARHQAGDWHGALCLCLEARNEAQYRDIVELDILICRHHLGAVGEVAGPALSLAPRLPVIPRLACWGLAMAGAHRAGDIGTVKAVACELARHFDSPWDLPTLPDFVFPIGERVIVMESSAVEPFLEMIRSVQTHTTNTGEESALLQALMERYEKRRAK